MDAGTDDYRKELKVLSRQFAKLLPSRLEEVETCWQALTEGGWNGDRLQAMVRAVHLLSGSASTFGFPALGRAAITVEKRLKSWNERGRRPSEQALDQVAAGVAAMRRAADVEPAGP